MTAACLILASASSARAALLRGAGVPFSAIPAKVDEEAIKTRYLAAGCSPALVAAELAAAKALALAPSNPNALVLGADQVLVHGGRLLSKAPTRSAARDQLRALRGGEHQLISAAALVRDGVVVWRDSQAATLAMRDFSDDFLEDYLDRTGDLALSSVGCYHLEGLGAQLFSRVDGDYFTVLGLPLIAVLGALREQGVIPT